MLAIALGQLDAGALIDICIANCAASLPGAEYVMGAPAPRLTAAISLNFVPARLADKLISGPDKGPGSVAVALTGVPKRVYDSGCG